MCDKLEKECLGTIIGTKITDIACKQATLPARTGSPGLGLLSQSQTRESMFYSSLLNAEYAIKVAETKDLSRTHGYIMAANAKQIEADAWERKRLRNLQ